MEELNEKRKEKVVLLGASGVGKSSIVIALNDDSNDENHEVNIYEHNTTIGSNMTELSRNVNGREYTIMLFDTAGQERFADNTKVYLRDAKIVIIVFDLSSSDSWDRVPRDYDVATNVLSDFITIIVGNKSDLAQEPQHQETASRLGEIAQNFAQEKGFEYIMTSARTKSGVSELANILFSMIEKIERDRENENINTLKLKRKSDPSKGNVCC